MGDVGWRVALGVALGALGGCDCGVAAAGGDAGAPPDVRGGDGGVDATVRSDSGPMPAEPCGAGIGRILVDLPPLEDTERQYHSLVVGRRDRVVVAQLDRLVSIWTGRVTIADAQTGARLRVAQASLRDEYAPMAVRGDDPYEVLWARQYQPFVIERIEGDAATTVIPDPSLADIYVPHAAGATPDGFVAIVQRDGGDWALAIVASDHVRYEPFPLVVDLETTLQPPESFGVALTDADERGVVYGALTTAAPPEDGRARQGLTAIRIDTRTTPYQLTSREIERWDRHTGIVSADVTGGGVVIGAYVVPPAAIRFYWLDDALDERGRWTSPAFDEFAKPIGAAGSGGRQVIAFEGWNVTSDPGLHVGVASGPGIVAGASRPLVNALDFWLGKRGRPWERETGELSVAYWRAGVEVITLCAPR